MYYSDFSLIVEEMAIVSKYLQEIVALQNIYVIIAFIKVVLSQKQKTINIYYLSLIVMNSAALSAVGQTKIKTKKNLAVISLKWSK